MYVLFDENMKLILTSEDSKQLERAAIKYTSNSGKSYSIYAQKKVISSSRVVSVKESDHEL